MSERYDYREAMEQDIREAIDERFDLQDYEDKEDAYEAIYEDLWIDDGVTGNASGSYWFNSWKAEEALCHNLDLLGEAVEEFGGCTDVMKDGAEACDVTIRCYLLGEVLGEILDEYEDEGAWDQDDDEDDEDDEEAI